MKVIVNIIWIFVGALLLFSGLIKINDPVGTAIKLEEYFEVFSHDFSTIFLAFKPFALYLSVFLSALEIVLGVALLVRWHLKTVLIALMVMMVFFTFLTFYSAYFNKVTDCGCFGDAIKLTPWESFTKDVVLIVLIAVLMGMRRYLQPFTKPAVGAAIVAASAIISVFIGVYAISHLPYLDFRTYKVGNNIPELMKPSAQLRYKYVMEKDGKLEEFEDYPTDTTYKFKEMVALNPEAGPKITDFNVWNDEGDFTQEMFKGNKLVIVVHDVHKVKTSNITDITSLISNAEASAKNIEPVVLTSSSSQDFDIFRHEVNLAAPYYFVDATVLKTMIRSNPGIMLIQEGTVKGKWSHNDTPDIEEINSRL